MRRFAACVLLLLPCLAGGDVFGPQIRGASPPASEPTLAGITGKTQPVPTRRGIIAPVARQPVVEVLVALGERVKKGQPLIKLDAAEPEADLRAKKAAVTELKATLGRLKAEPRQQDLDEAEALLETSGTAAKSARDLFERFVSVRQSGAIPEQRYNEAQAMLAKCLADERAAKARLERLRKRPFDLEVAELEAKVVQAEETVKAAEAELGDYTVAASIDGVVSRLDVSPGAVPCPGKTVWGEILDLSELDVRCDLTPDQADAVAVGQTVAISRDGPDKGSWHGRVLSVGVAADPATGQVPVLVRFANPEGRLRSGVPVRVNFGAAPRR